MNESDSKESRNDRRENEAQSPREDSAPKKPDGERRPSGKDTLNNVVLKHSDEHRVIIESVTEFDRIAGEKDSAEVVKKLTGWKNMLEKELPEHFRLEETIFFPAALSGKKPVEIIRIVLDLTREHGLMECGIESLVRKIDALEEDAARLDEVLTKDAREFLSILKTHAEREVKELFPFIDTDPYAKAVLRDLLLKRGAEGGM